jgi:hypothetical protein
MKNCISLISFLVLFCALNNSYAAENSAPQKEEGQSVNGEQKASDDAAVAQKCWSAKNCTGKVLSNRDAHNCKVKSRGKSWSNAQGVCTNL